MARIGIKYNPSGLCQSTKLREVILPARGQNVEYSDAKKGFLLKSLKLSDWNDIWYGRICKNKESMFAFEFCGRLVCFMTD